MQLLQLAVAAVLFLAAPQARAADDDYPRVWVNGGFFTEHFKSGDFREDNYGPGIEVAFTERHAFLLGSFINSDRERSRYAGYYWRPWQREAGPVRLSAGFVIGLIDGYSNTNDGGWFPAAAPFVSAEYGVLGANVAVIPHPQNGLAVALQLKLRVW